MKLMTTMFQNMFPSINVRKVSHSRHSHQHSISQWTCSMGLVNQPSGQANEYHGVETIAIDYMELTKLRQ